MKIKNARFVMSAPGLADVPDFTAPGTGIPPEVALVGRSNVGKSSFINTLIQRKNLAQTSNTPGKTRLINLYDIETDRGRLIFADLPGYGYAKVSKTEQAKWQKRLEEYLIHRPPLGMVVFLIDARHGPQSNDRQMAEWLAHYEIPRLTVITKSDKISKNAVTTMARQTAEAFELPTESVIAFSAETGIGKDAAWRALATLWHPDWAPRADTRVESVEALN